MRGKREEAAGSRKRGVGAWVGITRGIDRKRCEGARRDESYELRRLRNAKG